MTAVTNTRAASARAARPSLCVCALAALAGGTRRRPAPAAPRRSPPTKPRPAAASPSPRWRSAGATWYGPGLYGRHTACGQTLRPGTLGVAHRSLPCGTAVKFVFHGRQIVTRVIDRGPYAKGYRLDLTNGAREALDFAGSGRDPLRGRRRSTRDLRRPRCYGRWGG